LHTTVAPNKENEPEPAEIFKEQDQQLEAELIADIEGKAQKSNTQESVSDSTQGSFVDATMDNSDNLSIDEVNSKDKSLETTPERVAKDMEFLKQSWANIIDKDEAEASFLKDLEKEPEEQAMTADGFQMKVSKNKKKAQQKLKHLSRDTYATRSKVSSKPSL
jgi:hypothetical protein